MPTCSIPYNMNHSFVNTRFAVMAEHIISFAQGSLQNYLLFDEKVGISRCFT